MLQKAMFVQMARTNVILATATELITGVTVTGTVMTPRMKGVVPLATLVVDTVQLTSLNAPME